MFAGSDLSINLLSANHGNAWNVLMPGILVVGGVAWRGVGQGGGALEVKTRFSLCSLSIQFNSRALLAWETCVNIAKASEVDNI